jgi:hypothetical protein
MSSILYTTIDGLSYFLNAHYEVVTTLLCWAYTSVITARNTLSGIYSGVTLTCEVTATLIYDSVEILIHSAKLLVYVILKFSDLVLLILSWIELLIINVSNMQFGVM